MTHQDRILTFLEMNPGSTYEDITRGTGIGSPHRRISGKETPTGWTLRTEKVGKVYRHYASRGGIAPTSVAEAEVPIPEPTEGDLDAALSKLGIDRPAALR